jgi:hypothetical protein
MCAVSPRSTELVEVIPRHHVLLVGEPRGGRSDLLAALGRHSRPTRRGWTSLTSTTPTCRRTWRSKFDGTRHDAGLNEAPGLAMSRWNQLLSMEQQAIREEQQLALRPKTRPAQPGDEALPDRTLEQRNAAWLDETKHRRAAFAGLKEQAKVEPKLLEAFVVKRNETSGMKRDSRFPRRRHSRRSFGREPRRQRRSVSTHLTRRSRSPTRRSRRRSTWTSQR